MNEQEVQHTLDKEVTLPKGITGRNPVLAKELRTVMRQKRSRSVTTFYLIILAAITLLFYVTIISTNTVYPNPDIRRILGKIVFLAITIVEFMTVILIAPLFAADSITAERENKTLDLLQVTSLLPESIIKGKLFASITYILLLLLTGVPLKISAFLFGGITIAELMVSAVLLITSTIFLCSLSIWASVRLDRTSTAMGFAYAISSIVLLGFPILAYVIINLAPIPNDQGFFVALQSISRYLAPALQTVIIVVVWLLIASNPISTVVVNYNLFQNEGVQVLYDLSMYKIRLPLLAPWIVFVILYLTVSFLFYRSSVRKLAQSNKE